MGHRLSRPSEADFEWLTANLDVSFVKLSKCLISPGWRLALAAVAAPGIHYNLRGTGWLTVGNQPPIELLPHTLVISPPGQPVRIDGANGREAPLALRVAGAQWQLGDHSQVVERFVAGDGEPEVILICGCFRASCAASVDLFGMLHSPIVERFETADDLHNVLKSVLAEIGAQQFGMAAMTTALLKQVLVIILRRSLNSADSWLARFSTLNDRRVARAFADMLDRPRAPHRIQTLAQTAGLSRSAFMAHFTRSFGQSPMAALREVRMRRAAILLANDKRMIDEVARDAGYASRSSFHRAFRKAYLTDPSTYRSTTRRSIGQL
jgi:AraC-like DNA-binding protein